MFDITFEYPYLLLLIFLFIICGFFCKEKSPSFLFVHLDIFKQTNSNVNILLPILKYAIAIFAIIAIASPIKVLDSKLSKKDGVDIILSLDTSGSMKQIGFNPYNLQENRWDIVSTIVEDFIDKRINDNIGIVVFGTSVLTASPLSFDKNVQKDIVKYLEIGLLGERTAMIDSVASSINILKNSKSKSKIIILLTDGIDTASKIPLDIVNKLAIKHKIKIYAIGIGESNRILLDALTKQTDGKSYLATNKDDLIDIYNEIDKLEKSKLDKNRVILKEYLFFYPLFMSIMLLILYIYIKNKD